jgi:hypothetical protein
MDEGRAGKNLRHRRRVERPRAAAGAGRRDELPRAADRSFQERRAGRRVAGRARLAGGAAGKNPKWEKLVAGFTAPVPGSEIRPDKKAAKIYDKLLEKYAACEGEVTLEAEHFGHASATLKVSDGWLVGFNHGEWGGALYWFNLDGTMNYKISKHPIVDFIQTSNGIFAIEGVAHMGLSGGSIISISQSSNQGPWQVTAQCRLPQAPCAIVQHPDKSWLIVLSDSFVSVTPDGKITTVVKNARWGLLYPKSMVLSDDAKIVYVGMRQFVARVTLKNGRVSFLLPDRNYLNQLPKE